MSGSTSGQRLVRGDRIFFAHLCGAPARNFRAPGNLRIFLGDPLESPKGNSVHSQGIHGLHARLQSSPHFAI